MKTKIVMMLFALVLSSAMVFAQDTTKTIKKEKVKTTIDMQKDSAYYSCTMHSGVRLDKPGKCPECGMDLVKMTVKAGTNVNKSDALVSYTCKMHSEATSDKPGKCPKCGMDLIVKK